MFSVRAKCFIATLLFCLGTCVGAFADGQHSHSLEEDGHDNRSEGLDARRLAIKRLMWSDLKSQRDPVARIKLLGINDFHGQLSPTRVANRPTGGAAVLRSYLDAAAPRRGRRVDHSRRRPCRRVAAELGAVARRAFDQLPEFARERALHPFRQSREASATGAHGNAAALQRHRHARQPRVRRGHRRAAAPHLRRQSRGRAVPRVAVERRALPVRLVERAVGEATAEHVLPPFTVKCDRRRADRRDRRRAQGDADDRHAGRCGRASRSSTRPSDQRRSAAAQDTAACRRSS